MKIEGLSKGMKVLFVNSPNQKISEGNHTATISSDAATTFETKTKATGEPLAIVSIKVEIEGFPPFSCAVITEDAVNFLKDKKKGDEVAINISKNDKGYLQAQI